MQSTHNQDMHNSSVECRPTTGDSRQMFAISCTQCHIRSSALFTTFQHGHGCFVQLCEGGELHASLEGKSEAFTYGDVGQIAVTMLMLVDAMHTRGLVHCDLKPENFCFRHSLSAGVPLKENLRLIDFGLSQRVRGGQAIAGLAGSIPYMAPEIKTRMYDHKVDIWSIGVIIYTLLNGNLPFDGRSAEEIISKAATHQADVSQLHPAVGDFVLWCAGLVAFCIVWE
jgi:serine/threonine protein kinase